MKCWLPHACLRARVCMAVQSSLGRHQVCCELRCNAATYQEECAARVPTQAPQHWVQFFQLPAVMVVMVVVWWCLCQPATVSHPTACTCKGRLHQMACNTATGCSS